MNALEMATDTDTVAPQSDLPVGVRRRSLFVSSYGEKGVLLGIVRRILRRDKVDITEKDPTLKVIYLGNVVTTWAKSDGCLERPASALWRNHNNGRGSIKMTVSVTPSGLKAYTAEHGLTEYWANRLTWTGVPTDYPKLFCWIYRHEGRKLKQELRCHAVLCPSQERAVSLATSLRNRLAEALFDFRREKQLRQNARLSVIQSLYPYSMCGHVHSQNYKPPIEKARAAPKLTAIEENEEPPPSPPPSLSHLNDEPLLHTVPDDTTRSNAVKETDNFPQTSLLLSELNPYSTVMVHLLELPQANGTREYPGSANSDPVSDSSDTESHCDYGNQGGEAIDDSVSDESGYSEDTVESPVSPNVGSTGTKNNTPLDTGVPSNGRKVTQCLTDVKRTDDSSLPSSTKCIPSPPSVAQPALVLFHNLSFEI